MNSNKDEPGKDPASGPGAGRPHATLDLKATVVKPPEASQPRQGREGGCRPSRRKPGAAAAQPGALPRAEAGRRQSGGRQPTATKPAAAPRPGGGYGGFFTHLRPAWLAACMALLAADMLASQLGFQGPADRSDVAPALAAAHRRARGRQRPESGAGAELAARLAEAEAKLAKLEPVGAKIDQLAQRQGELDRSLKEAAAKGARPASAPSDGARIGKLEERLATLSAAAARDPGADGCRSSRP